ncbi:Ig-like domain-containing protein [Laspinema olomoucense]|uniref:Ig-like domain-containing protein n=1 Tax=Laspinema olomoucense TaxID=3231600 RepID=UPI0021BA9981|nr:Ig-like domain-containing protein [Laspinema sp. D3a]MCT7991379.1 Ig-like domain-containing protein [Laspinema sp. D3a]
MNPLTLTQLVSVTSATPQDRSIVIIDAAVADWQSLAASVVPGTEVVVLHPQQDGVSQIGKLLTNRSNIQAVHILSHGQPGCLFLGSVLLNADNLDSYSEILQEWKSALSDEADILLYGCNVAATQAGEAFLYRLSALTGANIAASDDLTGNEALGGDWELEKTTGAIAASLPFSPEAIRTYAGVLSGVVQFDLTSVFDRDVIINNTGGVTDPTQNGLSNSSETLVTQSFATLKAGANGNGLPDNGFFAANTYHPDLQLGYNNNNDGNNAKVLTANGQSFTFSVTPNQYSQIHLIATSSDGNAGMQVTFNYSDGTTETKTATVQDWFNNIVESFDNYYVIDGLDRNFDTTGSSASSYHDANAVAVFGFGFNINPAKTLSSITINKTSGSLTTNYLGVFGATGVLESTPPTISNLTPADNATNIAGGANLVATFSETVQKGIGNLIIKKVSDSSVVETIDVTSTNVTVTGNTVTINPINDLVEGTQYYVEIAPQAIRDLAGNNFAGITGAIPWNFTTADTAAPTISSLTPADNATNIAGGANLVATFSETVQKGIGNIVIKKVSDDSVVETIDVTSTNVTITGNTVTINPINDLVEGTQYYVEIAPQAIRDLAGNNFAGITGAIPWNFTTADTAAPNAPAIATISGDSGIPNDSTTSDPTLIFAGTAEANSTVTLFKDGTSIGTTTADGTGNWTFDYTATTLTNGTYSFTATATDTANNTSNPSAPFNVTVDTVAPTVTINQDPGQSDPTAATTMNFAVVFSEPVTGFDGSDITLGGTAGATTATVTPVGGDSKTYNVAVTGMTGAGTVTASVNVGAASDTAGNTSTASTSSDNEVSYDNSIPTVTSIVPADANPSNAATVNYTVTFSETVTSVDASDFSLVAGSIADAAITSVTGSGNTYIVAVNTGTGDGTIQLELNDDDSIINSLSVPLGGVGIDNGSSIGQIYTIDKGGSTVTAIASTLADGSYTVGQVIPITVTFNKVLNVTGNPELSLNSGGTATYTSGSGTNTLTFNYIVAAGQNVVDLDATAFVLAGGTIKDTLGNDAALTLPAAGATSSLGGAKNIAVDTVVPTVTLGATASGTVNTPFSVNTTFSETVTGFAAGDINLTNATLSNFTGTGTNYSFTVTPTGSGTVSVNVPAGAATDAAGNSNTAATPLTLGADVTPPTVTLATTASGTVNAPFSVNATFSETVTGFAADDISLTNATLSNFTGTGTNYSFTVTPTGSGTVSVNVPAGAATDAAGNSNTAATPLTLGADVTPPTVTLATTASGTVNAPFSVNAAFSETVTGFALNDIIATNGTVSNFTGSGTTYSFIVTPTGSGTVSVNLPAGGATDAAGNSNTAATPLTRTADTTPPSVTLASTAASTINAPFSVNAAFSETVTGFALNDIIATNGTVSNFTGSGTTYSFIVTPTGSGTVSVNLPAGGATDAAGNSNTAATPLTRTADTTRPSVTLASTAASTINAPFSVNAAFSETVTGFALNDIIATNGTVSNFTGSGTTYSFTVTPTGSGTVSVNVPVGGATDAAGNSNTAATPLTRNADTTRPSVTSVTSTVLDKKYTAGTLIPITINFSEAVNVTGKPELTLNSRGKAVYASGSGTSGLVFNYTVGAGENTGDLDYASATALALNNGTIKDTAGNNAVLTLPKAGETSSLSAAKAIQIVPGFYSVLQLEEYLNKIYANHPLNANVKEPLLAAFSAFEKGEPDPANTLTATGSFDGTKIELIPINSWQIPIDNLLNSVQSDGSGFNSQISTLLNSLNSVGLSIPLPAPSLTITDLRSAPIYEFAAKVPVPNTGEVYNFIKNTLGIQEITLKAGLNTAPTGGGPSVSASLDVNKKLVDIAGFTIEFVGGDLSAGIDEKLQGTIEITPKLLLKNYDPTQNNEPELKLSGLLTFQKDSFTGGFKVEGVNSNEPAVWKNPFSLPNSELRSASLELKKDLKSGSIGEVLLGGDLKYGNLDITLSGLAIDVAKGVPKALVLTANKPVNLVDIWAMQSFGFSPVSQAIQKIEPIQWGIKFLKGIIDVNIISVDSDKDGKLDPLLKFVPESTTIGGTTIQPGFAINGEVNAWGKKATLILEANPFNTNPNFQGSLTLPSLDLGVISFTGDEKDKDLDAGTLNLDLLLNTSDPYLQTAAKVKLFGKELAGVNLKVGDNGFTATGNLNLLPGILEIQNAVIDIKSPTDIKIGGKVKILGQTLAGTGISIKDGKLNISANLEIDLPIVGQVGANLTISSDASLSNFKIAVGFNGPLSHLKYELDLAPVKSIEDIFARAVDEAFGSGLKIVNRPLAK